MIGRLVGEAVVRTPGRLVVDVAGVGYEVLISLTSYAGLPAAGPVTLLIHTHVRESEITLYGFLDPRERLLFRRLQTVAGIGPRLALGILSQIPPEPLAAAIRERDISRLVALPGVGKRTAERIVTELSEKLGEPELGPAGGGPSAAGTGAARGDARQALVHLGYREAAVDQALEAVLADEPGPLPVEDLLRRCLQRLSGR